MLFFALIAILPLALAQFPQPLSYFANNKVLVDGVYNLYWNYTKTNITFEIQVKTTGWVGFGISPNGGMAGSDVIVAWFDNNGNVNFTDRYLTYYRGALIDRQQDWFLINSRRANGFVQYQFWRNINTCDPYETDLSVPDGTPKVVFSWNDEAPAPNGDISYHGFNNRGSKVVQLLTALNQKLIITPDDMMESYNFNVDVTLPPIETYYHCHMFKLPQNLINNKRHLLRILTLVTPGDENYVHHWLMFQCSRDFETQYLANYSVPLPGHCFDDEWTNSANAPKTWLTVSHYCRQGTLAWAVGGELVTDFPNGLGLPIGGTDREFTYFYLQMHYNNPDQTQGIADKTGIQLNVTPKLRPTEIGLLTVGAASFWSAILIPPGEDSFKLKYFCNRGCLDNFYQGQPVTIFGVAPHTHVTGISVTSTQVRNGVEIGYIDKNLYYDFNYQYFNFLQQPVVLQPGDEIQVTCTYRTSGKTTYTLGGEGTPQEMCLDFLMYYPRRPNTGICASFSENWDGLFSKLVKNNKFSFSKNPPEGDSLEQDLKTRLSFDPETVKMIRNFFDTTNQSLYCAMNQVETLTTAPRFNPVPIVDTDPCTVLNQAPKFTLKLYLYSLGLISFLLF